MLFRSLILPLLIVLALFLAATAAIGGKDDVSQLAQLVSEGRWGALASLLLAALFALLMWPELTGWLDDRTHPRESPRGHGTLNISVGDYEFINTHGAYGEWFVTRDLMIANHTRERMVLRVRLHIRLKPGANDGAPLVLRAVKDDPATDGLRVPHRSEPFVGPIRIPARDYVEGYFVFFVPSRVVSGDFGGNLNASRSGPIDIEFEDIFTDRYRRGGIASRLRKLH